jgi:hypothetical protein
MDGTKVAEHALQPVLKDGANMTEVNRVSRRRVDLTRSDEARAWTRHFGVTQQKLAALVSKVGPSAAAVRKELTDEDLWSVHGPEGRQQKVQRRSAGSLLVRRFRASQAVPP